ncbi:MAG: hypothetical protein IT567_00490 [Alphaproteobacteria bacterium]|nr:hypothetical protein [Alphaproteobacteria bacterium]
MPIAAIQRYNHAKFNDGSFKFSLTIGEYSIANVQTNLGKQVAEILDGIPHLFATSNTAAIPKLLAGRVSGCTSHGKSAEISCSVKLSDVTPDILAKIDKAFAGFAHLDVSKAIGI